MRVHACMCICVCSCVLRAYVHLLCCVTDFRLQKIRSMDQRCPQADPHRPYVDKIISHVCCIHRHTHTCKTHHSRRCTHPPPQHVHQRTQHTHDPHFTLISDLISDQCPPQFGLMSEGAGHTTITYSNLVKIHMKLMRADHNARLNKACVPPSHTHTFTYTTFTYTHIYTYAQTRRTHLHTRTL